MEKVFTPYQWRILRHNRQRLRDEVVSAIQTAEKEVEDVCIALEEIDRIKEGTFAGGYLQRYNVERIDVYPVTIFTIKESRDFVIVELLWSLASAEEQGIVP